MNTEGHGLSSSTSFSASPERLSGPRDLAGLHRDVWKVMTRHPLVFMVFPALAFLPSDIITFASTYVKLPTIAQTIVQVLSTAWITGVLLHAMRVMGDGEKPSLSTSIVKGGAAGAALFATLFVANILSGLALLLLIVPGLYLMSKYLLVMPAAIFENVTFGEARRRSGELVASRGTWKMLGWCFVGAMPWLAIGMLPTFATTFIVTTEDVSVQLVVSLLSGLPLSVVCGAFIVAAGILYFDTAAQKAQYPVGLELRTQKGQRLAGPSSSGMAGLVAAGAAGAVCFFVLLPLALIPVMLEVEPEATRSIIDSSPLLQDLFYDDVAIDPAALEEALKQVQP